VHSAASTESCPTRRRRPCSAVCRSERSGCESAGEGRKGGGGEGSGQKAARKRRSVEMSGGEDDCAASMCNVQCNLAETRAVRSTQSLERIASCSECAKVDQARAKASKLQRS
jgi:hypothetical protein